MKDSQWAKKWPKKLINIKKSPIKNSNTFISSRIIILIKKNIIRLHLVQT